MKRKVKSLERLTKAQKMAHDLARHRHAVAELNKTALEQKQADVLAALGRDEFGFGALASIVTNCARRLDMEISAADQELVRRREESIRQGARANVAGELLSDARKSMVERALRSELGEIIETLARTKSQA